MNKFFKINNICCEEVIPNNFDQIVVYCHGFGESKDEINFHKEILNKHNIGIISFDFPCHGDDISLNEEFNISNCLLYLDNVIKHSKKYKVPLSLVGESFGGYIILCYINQYEEKFYKVYLKFPAVNFYECTKRKLKIDDSYFENNDFYTLLNGKKIYKNAYYEFKNNDIMNTYNKNNNDIFIIHGDHDKTVLIEDIIAFCKKNDIKLEIVKGASHGMKEQLKLVNDKLIDFIR